MRKKGFTLIELLAVIVILAVIALIAVPLILSLVNKSRQKAAEESALFYVDTIENMLMINNIENTDGKTYKVKGKTVVDENNEVILNLEIKGDTPYNGVTNEIKINSGFVETANLRFNAYYVHYEMDMETKEFKTCTSQKGFLDKCDGTGSITPSVPDEPKKDGPTIEIAKDKTYLAEVYLDPTDISKTCTKEEALANVNEFGTPTEVVSGCMKWYVYKDDGENYTMILDHNIINTVYWNSSGDNRNGMKEVNEILKRYTEKWEDTIKTSTRLITADEIAEITGASREDTLKWDSSKLFVRGNITDTENVSSFYLDGTGTNYSDTEGWQKQVAKTLGSSNYAWVYDYTYQCGSYGCSVTDDNVYSKGGRKAYISGYWTSSIVLATGSDANTSAWIVNKYGLLSFSTVGSYGAGIRPVITVSKNIFDKKGDNPDSEVIGVLKEVVKLGDYISYTPISTSYTIRKEDTGRSQDFIINPSELNLWRVIRINEDGTVEVVSEYISSQKVYFYGSVGYNNYIGTLNKIAKQYETEGITVGSRHMGYDATKASEYVTDNRQSDEGYKTDAELVKTAIGTLMARIEKRTNYSSYTIASRGNGTTRYLIDSEGKQTWGDDNKVDYGGARPILVFSAKLKAMSGDGSVNQPYELSI